MQHTVRGPGQLSFVGFRVVPMDCASTQTLLQVQTVVCVKQFVTFRRHAHSCACAPHRHATPFTVDRLFAAAEHSPVVAPQLCFGQPLILGQYDAFSNDGRMFAVQIFACDAPSAKALDTRGRTPLQAIELCVTLLFANQFTVRRPSRQRPGSPPPHEALHE